MSNNGTVILLMLALMFGGIMMGFNLIESWLGFDLGIGFGDIHNAVTFITIILARLVGFALIVLPIWVIGNIIRG